ncbi:hypothetical protein [Veronia pacifica]|uniref:Uncharacterized protein n=1 Tax=Veronia pacifica TaxID=1080227 RepID=A0A1C3EPD0_9GAMM|nr:hypothetical protein [Veronia pacifica]ODA35088.1 hypothetical protein A8L45_05265 [Veronia pacifica]
MKRKASPKTRFPLDFYGEDSTWRFAVRAQNANEVLDALFWRAYLSVRRKEVNLFSAAVNTFAYECHESSSRAAEISASHGVVMKIKMMGPIVNVSALNKLAEEVSISAETCAA